MGASEGPLEAVAVTLPVVLRADAASDVYLARDWYERQRVGLGSEFVTAVDELLSQIGIAPLMFSTALREVRRAKLRRFPYITYYRVLDDRVEVLGVLHASRDPRIWQQRT